MSGSLEFGRNDAICFGSCDGKGNQSRRNIYFFKGAAHGVLASNGADAQFSLGFESAKQCRHRLSPALAVPAGVFEVFLECQINIRKVRAGRNQFADRFHNGKIRAVIGALFGQIRVVTERHQGAVVRVFLFNGYFLYHCLNRRQLIFSAERHQHGPGTDCRVKAFGKSALGADIQISGKRKIEVFESTDRLFFFDCGALGVNADVLGGTVGIEKSAAEINNLFTVPMHNQAWIFRNGCNRGCG